MNIVNNVHPGIICLVLFTAAYFLGGIPFGVVVARAKGVDIMKFGSGNIGATNVMRALGAPLGIFVFVLDVIKGTIPSLAARWLLPHPWGPVDAQVLWMGAGLMAVLGHCLSPYLKFKGGKGVATAFGIGLGCCAARGGLAVAFALEWQQDAEHRALRDRFPFDDAAVVAHDLGDQRKPEARAGAL